MLASYGYVGLMLVIAIIVPIGMLLIPFLLSRIGVIHSKPSPEKGLPYECGMDTIGRTWVQFNFRYYLFALLFVLFDIETVFLYPWAVAYKQLRLFGLVEMLIFIFILVVGFVYAWKKGALEWK